MPQSNCLFIFRSTLAYPSYCESIDSYVHVSIDSSSIESIDSQQLPSLMPLKKPKIALRSSTSEATHPAPLNHRAQRAL